MKKHILFAGLLAILVPGINPGTARAQDSIKVSDEKLILKAAENSLASFQELLNNLCNPENTEDDKMQVVKNAFGKENPQFKFFLNEHVQIDDDQDPAGSKGETDADLYLNQFSHSLTGSDGAVQFKITSKSLIKTQNKSLYLNVYYTETFNGKCMLPGKQDQVYPERVRVAQMQVRPDVITTWKCLISNVKDYDKEHDPITSAPNVKIYNTESSKDLAVKLQPEAYYASKYALGNARFGDGDYMGAYIAYRDCAPSPVYGPLSEQKIGNDLKNKFTPYSPDSFYQKGLTERVEGFKSKKNFAAAKKCYQYLYEITPTDKFLPGAIEEMTNLLDEQKQIAELYYKHLYKDAIARYTLAISRNGDVPDLYIGRAKCYAAEGRFQDAENDFNKAISTDRSNVNAYAEQASYFINAGKQSAQKLQDYKNAYKALTTYLMLYPETYGLDTIQSKLAYAKGMQAYLNGDKTEASDSFYAARSYDPTNIKAYRMLAQCYYDDRNTDSASKILAQASKLNNKASDIHYLNGKILMSNGNKAEYKKGIDELEMAASDEKNGLYNLDYASQLRRGAIGKKTDKKEYYQKAIKYFTNCINNDSVRSASAYFNRGRCYSYLGSNAEAITDFETVKEKYGNNAMFNKEYGRVLIKAQKYAEAIACFEKVSQDDPEMWYGKAEAMYLSEPNASEADKKKYMECFKKAFSKAIPHSIVEEDVYAQQLEKNKEFKKLKVEYKYW